MQLTRPQQRLYRPDDPGLAADHDPLADLERLAAEMTGRDHLVAATQLVTVLDSHRQKVYQDPSASPGSVSKATVGPLDSARAWNACARRQRGRTTRAGASTAVAAGIASAPGPNPLIPRRARWRQRQR